MSVSLEVRSGSNLCAPIQDHIRAHNQTMDAFAYPQMAPYYSGTSIQGQLQLKLPKPHVGTYSFLY
jgi:hypothetical protein